MNEHTNPTSHDHGPAAYPLSRLFLQFLQFGLFTFGGGSSIVAQIQKKYVEEEKVISSGELLDLVSVARSLPGVMIGNAAVLFGHHMAGIPGSIVCLMGMALPPLAVLTIITGFYGAFSTNPWIIAAMRGIRCSIAPIIAAALAGMLKGSFTLPPCVPVALGAFALYHFLGLSSALIVVFGAACGLVISSFYEKKGGPIA